MEFLFNQFSTKSTHPNIHSNHHFPPQHQLAPYFLFISLVFSVFTIREVSLVNTPNYSQLIHNQFNLREASIKLMHKSCQQQMALLQSLMTEQGNTEVLLCIHQINSHFYQLSRQNELTLLTLEQLKAEDKELKNTVKKLKKSCKAQEEEIKNLQNEVTRVNEKWELKVEKILKNQNRDKVSEKQMQKLPNTQRLESSCDIHETAKVIKLLKEDIGYLQNKVVNLMKMFEDEKNENQSKTLQIKELVKALEIRDQQIAYMHEIQKENDNSTLDDNSDKDQQEDDLLPELEIQTSSSKAFIAEQGTEGAEENRALTQTRSLMQLMAQSWQKLMKLVFKAN